MTNVTNKDYNTSRPQLIIPEYGRNIQKMVEHAMTIEDDVERNKIAKSIIVVMGQLNPHLRDIADFKHKLWDHLFIISDFKLKVDSPYPIPNKEIIFKKPERMVYPQKKIKFKHYGKSIENLIEKASEEEEGERKEELIKRILNLMKKTYLIWNKGNIEDAFIFSDLKRLSNNKLDIPPYKLISTQEVLSMYKTKRRPSSNKNQKSSYKYKGHKKRT